MTRPFACVVDASVTVKLFLAEPLSAEATVLFGVLSLTRPRILCEWEDNRLLFFCGSDATST